MTVPGAIRELEKIEMIKGIDGIYRLDHAVTATLILLSSLYFSFEKLYPIYLLKIDLCITGRIFISV